MENYIIANCTDTGRVRSVNEDSMTTFDSPNGRVVVVCDGMGGQKAGDVASQLAVAVIQDILTDNTFATAEEAINSSIIAANQAILRRASQNDGLSGMGATCVMIIIRDGQVYYGSVGDSRIYYVANRNIHQITKDQSYVQALVDSGQISKEDAEHHQDKNQITNALGLENMTPPVIGQMPITPEPGGVFVLCSDGLSGMVSNNAILNTVTRYDLPLKERADMLVSQANDAGGVDNITVQLVEFPGGGGKRGSMQPNGYTSTRAKKSHTLLYSIIGLLMVAIAGGGIYWYLNKDSKPQTKPEVIMKNTQTQAKPQPKAETAEPSAPETTNSTKEVKKVITVKESEPVKTVKPKVTDNKISTKKAITKEAQKATDKKGSSKTEEIKKKIVEEKSGDTGRKEKDGIVYENLKGEK
mgnify:FL=1